MFSACKQQYTPERRCLLGATLQVLLDAKVGAVKDAIIATSTEATQEASLEDLLAKVVAKWAEIELSVIPYKDSKDVYILGSIDNVQVRQWLCYLHSNSPASACWLHALSELHCFLWRAVSSPAAKASTECRHRQNVWPACAVIAPTYWVLVSCVLQAALEDSLVTMSTIMSSRFVAAIRSEVEKVERQLNNFSKTLDQWVQVGLWLGGAASTAEARTASPLLRDLLSACRGFVRPLRLAQRFIDCWLYALPPPTQVQKSWMYLELIFSAQDIQKQLPQEHKAFDTVHKQLRDIMRHTKERPNALQAANITSEASAVCAHARPVTMLSHLLPCSFLRQVTTSWPPHRIPPLPTNTGPGRQTLMERLTSCYTTLESIQKSLEEYLETKRVTFPRFYFLSNDELLEILAQAKNAQAVQPHMGKYFDGIRRLDFGDDPKGTEIFAMVSGRAGAPHTTVALLRGRGCAGWPGSRGAPSLRQQGSLPGWQRLDWQVDPRYLQNLPMHKRRACLPASCLRAC